MWMCIGSKVTGKQPTYFDGTLVLNWPKQVGTVTKFHYSYGVYYAVVKYASGRIESYPVEEYYSLGA